MTDQLTPGQSLTPEQVRNLPDGAKAMMRRFRGEDVEWINSPGFQSASRIADMMESGAFIGAVLVSLPAQEPSPGEGYRWVKPEEYLEHNDEVGGAQWVKTEYAGYVCGETNGYRRRIEPQADNAVFVGICPHCKRSMNENVHALCGVINPVYIQSGSPAPGPTPRASSEIEKEAAWALLGNLSDDVRCAATGDCADVDSVNVLEDECKKYINAVAYARSIGAIE